MEPSSRLEARPGNGPGLQRSVECQEPGGSLRRNRELKSNVSPGTTEIITRTGRWSAVKGRPTPGGQVSDGTADWLP